MVIELTYEMGWPAEWGDAANSTVLLSKTFWLMLVSLLLTLDVSSAVVELRFESDMSLWRAVVILFAAAAAAAAGRRKRATGEPFLRRTFPLVLISATALSIKPLVFITSVWLRISAHSVCIRHFIIVAIDINCFKRLSIEIYDKRSS